MSDGISNRQLFFMIAISTIGFSTLKLPKIMAETAGTGAWLVLLLAAVFFVADVSIIVYLGTQYNGKSLFEYSRLLVGKPLACCFSAVYVVYFFIMLTFVVRSSADVIKSEILFYTPVWATMLLILAMALYAASKGLTNIGRIIEYIGLIILITGFSLCFLMFTQGNSLNLRPFFNASEKNAYIHALPSTVFYYLGFECITIVPFSKSNGKQAVKAAVLAILILCIYFILIVESCYAILGIDDIVNYAYPLISAIRRLDIAILQFAKRLDLFFIMAWLASVFCSAAMISFAAAAYIKKLIPKAAISFILIVIGLLSFFAGQLIPSADKVSELFISFITFFGLIPAFFIPLVLLLIHRFKRGNGETVLKQR